MAVAVIKAIPKNNATIITVKVFKFEKANVSESLIIRFGLLYSYDTKPAVYNAIYPSLLNKFKCEGTSEQPTDILPEACPFI